MNEKIRLKGQLKSYMRWPLLLTILLVLMNIWIYVIDLRAGALMTAFVIVYVLVVFILYIYNKPLIVNELTSCRLLCVLPSKNLVVTFLVIAAGLTHHLFQCFPLRTDFINQAIALYFAVF